MKNGSGQMGENKHEKNEGSWAWCEACFGVIRGRCLCMMYQDGIDTSECPAHRKGVHVGGGCKCTPKSKNPLFRREEDAIFTDTTGEEWPELAFRVETRTITQRFVIRSDVKAEPIHLTNENELIYCQGLWDGKIIGETREQKRIETDIQEINSKLDALFELSITDEVLKKKLEEIRCSITEIIKSENKTQT